LNHAERRRNYLSQPGGVRTHSLGSEGGLTGPQRKRLTKKMGHRKRYVLKRKRAAATPGPALALAREDDTKGAQDDGHRV